MNILNGHKKQKNVTKYNFMSFLWNIIGLFKMSFVM